MLEDLIKKIEAGEVVYWSNIQEELESTPDAAKDILTAYQTGLSSNRNNSASLPEAYWVLAELAEKHPELGKDIVTAYQTGLSSDGNDYDSLRDAYQLLGKLADNRPELGKDIVTAYQNGLSSDRNNSYSLRAAYEDLGKLAESSPELWKDILTAYQTGLSSNRNNSDSLRDAYWALAKLDEKHPELGKDILTTIQTGLNSDKDNDFSFQAACQTLAKLDEKHPELGKDILTTFQTELSSKENLSYSLEAAYEALAKLDEKHPELGKDILTPLQTGLSSNGNDYDSLRAAYKALAKLADNSPELGKDIVTTIQTGLSSDRNNSYSLQDAYEALAKLAESHPELGKNIVTALQTGLSSDENSHDSLLDAYKALAKLAESRPELGKDILTSIQTGFSSDPNDYVSLKKAYEALAKLADNIPELGKDILTTIQTGLSSKGNKSISLKYAYKALANISRNKPELSSDIIHTVLEHSNKYKILALAPCCKRMKETDLEKFPAEQQIDMKAAYRLRFSTKDEISWFLENMDIDKIAEKNLSAQQRCMNVLVGRVCGENGISAAESSQYRQGDNPAVQECYSNNKDWLIPASLNAADMFGCYFPAYLKKVDGHLSTHDAVYWLPKDMGKEKNESFARFMQNNVIYLQEGEKKCRPLEELSAISRNWSSLTKDDEKLRYKDVLAICRSKKYTEQKYVNFAAEAAKFSYPEEDYKNCESFYAAGLDVPEPFDSGKEFKFGKYTGKFLPRDDARAGFFGNYTDCCQHFGGAGHACAVSSIKDPYSQLFVIENEKGRIIGGSWVWENTEGKYREVCFDNIEAIGEYKKNPVVNKIYEQAAKYLCEEANCRRVTIGLGYQDADVSGYKRTKAINLPKTYGENYSDAGNQVLLRENPKAAPLEKAKESQRFIRNVCCEDIDAMDRISEVCFPEGDQQLQKPDRMSGKVLVDRDKGVVGYCLYDEKEKSVYDMAVLPEYRTDENKSSSRLFVAVQKEIYKLGGEWTAELRDSTTYRYMKIMQARGLVKMQTLGVDHEMSDGNKVYAVKFQPIERNKQQESQNTTSKSRQNTATK